MAFSRAAKQAKSKVNLTVADMIHGILKNFYMKKKTLHGVLVRGFH